MVDGSKGKVEGSYGGVEGRGKGEREGLRQLAN